MAVLGLQTLNGINIYNVDSDPSQAPGLEAPQGSIAVFNGVIYSRFNEATATDWLIQTNNTVYLDSSNGAVAGGNIYTDWTSAHAAAAAIGGPAFIRVLGTTAFDIPSGTYDMENIIIEGPITGGIGNINIRDGASFTNLTRLGENLFFRNFDASTPPILQTINTTLSITVGRNTILRNNVVGGALIRVTAGTLRLVFDSANMTFGSQPTIDITTSNASSTITLNGTSEIDDDHISGTSSLEIIINDHGGSFDTDQPNHSGSITVTDNTAESTAIIQLLPKDAELPASGGMTLSSRNNHSILEAPDVTDSAAYWPFVVPSNYQGGNIRIIVYGTKASAVVGNVRIRTAVEALSSGSDITTDSFLIDAGMILSPSVDGQLAMTSVTVGAASIGNPVGGDLLRLRIQRLPSDAADSLAATAQITHVVLDEV